MPSTYTPIATYTVSGTPSSYTFSSIPSTYTDLILIGGGAASGDGSLMLRFNGDTGTNYSTTYLYGVGSGSGTSGRVSNDTYIVGMGRVGTNPGTSVVHIQNYSNTTTYKSVIGRGANADVITIAAVGTWRSNSAINSITIAIEGGKTFSAGNVLTLYGIKAA